MRYKCKCRNCNSYFEYFLPSMICRDCLSPLAYKRDLMLLLNSLIKDPIRIHIP